MRKPGPGVVRELWTVYVKSTGKRGTVVCFNSREQVEAQIEEWQRRQDRGRRPDVNAYDLEPGPVRWGESWP